MKHFLLSAIAAAALLVAAPAHAIEHSGYGGIAYANVDTENSDADDGVVVEGAVAFDATESLGVEVDAFFGDIEDVEGYGANAHVYSDTGTYKFGGFVGLGQVDEDNLFAVGVEGAAHLSNVTLLGALGYGEDDATHDGTIAADAQARFFLTDNFRLQGRLGYAETDTDLGDDDTWRYGAGAEFQLDAFPVSFYANYDRFEQDRADVDAFLIGARYSFGSGTLRDRDTQGPTFAGVSSLNSGAF